MSKACLRRRTGNRRGLQDALRAIVAAGGNVGRTWPVERVLSTADAGTGTHVLVELYEQMKDTPVRVDLPALWRQLGVSMQSGIVNFDESAPLSTIRRAITAAPAVAS